MIVIAGIATVWVAIAAGLALYRVYRGPTMLDRTVGFDVLTTALIGALAIEAWWSRRAEAIPILVVLSLVGFLSSALIARYAALEPDEPKRRGKDDG